MSSSTVPLNQFVLKVHSRCDLACDHCYVYQSADQSWRGRPMALADEVISQAGSRIAEHAAAHHLETVQVILHGGEPLLAGADRLRRIIATLESAVHDICRLDLRIHTNGVLLDEEFCELFAEHGVKVGISLDGDQAANDRHRRYADGRSSYAKVQQAIALLRSVRYRDLYAGLLCTIDVRNDPLAVYQALIDLDPPRIDFLLPHATWDTPPPRTRANASEYANWLIAIFDRWTADGYPTGIRTFESIISTLTGGGSLTEALGLGPSNLAVIETDGTYEQADSLKSAFDGAPATGFDVFRHAVDVVAQHPGIVARQQGRAGLCHTCQQCPVVTSCGGGLYAHRYRTGTAFANPSVYCEDLLELITHIQGTLPPTVAAPDGIPTHAVTASVFHALASGFGDAAAMASLAEGQRSLRRTLLSVVYAEAGAAALPPAVRADARSAWSLLASIEQQQPHVVDAVLGHPYVRVWAVQCLQRLTDATPGSADDRVRDERDLAARLGHLGAIAAAAALRAGVSARVAVPVIEGAVHLPTLGRLMTPGGRSSENRATAGAQDRATVDINDAITTVTTGAGQWSLMTADLLPDRTRPGEPAGAGPPAAWQPVRMLRAPGISVVLEDTDPYRDCHQWKAASRLTDAEFARWHEHFERAWQLIRDEHENYAPALAASLSTLMPLAAGTDHRDISAAARDAFGAVAAALPADPVTLALLLIHEFQHVKLGAVLDLYDLYDPADRRLYHAPWRDDPRPFEGLLQGTYAHLAVTDFWRTRRAATAGPAAEAAQKRFEHWSVHTRNAIQTLTESGALTQLGMQFVEDMRNSVCS
jgi:uncharacterized protein